MWLASLGGRGFHRAEQKIQVGGGGRDAIGSLSIFCARPVLLFCSLAFLGGRFLWVTRTPNGSTDGANALVGGGLGDCLEGELGIIYGQAQRLKVKLGIIYGQARRLRVNRHTSPLSPPLIH